jgi:benzoate-CoA ligase family protein
MQTYNACSDLLDRQASGPGASRQAVLTRDRSVTYGELADEVGRTATGLAAAGVQPEQRVAMVMLDSIEFYAVFLGAMRIGAVPVPINPLLPGRDLGPIVAGSRARVLIISPERAAELDAIRAVAVELDLVIVAGAEEWHALLASGPPGRTYPTWPESPGFWLCTSGSTGTPKLAMHRHADLRASADTYGQAVLGIQPDDRFYSVGPMFHAYGLGNSLSFPFSVGATAIVDRTRPPTPALVAELVRTFEPTLFFCLPTFCSALLASDIADDTFASVRFGISAAEALPADLFARFRDRFGVEILDGIGSTEMTHIFISNAPGDIRPGTSGRPVAGHEATLVDDAGHPVADGEPGHLLVSGPGMATGYWCASEPTRRSFRGRQFATGDMYTRSADGYYSYLGRSDDMLRVGGEWVSPAEVEATLISHPGLLEVAVVGERDEAGIQRAVAYLVAAPGATVATGELDVLCKSELAGYKRPRRYEFLAELPKTATGKIQRYKLRPSGG